MIGPSLVIFFHTAHSLALEGSLSLAKPLAVRISLSRALRAVRRKLTRASRSQVYLAYAIFIHLESLKSPRNELSKNFSPISAERAAAVQVSYMHIGARVVSFTRNPLSSWRRADLHRLGCRHFTLEWLALPLFRVRGFCCHSFALGRGSGARRMYVFI